MSSKSGSGRSSETEIVVEFSLDFAGCDDFDL